jgi:hypothetical protein
LHLILPQYLKLYMKNKKIIQIIAVFACILLVVLCFTPWVHYNSIDTTFTGYHVTKFNTGVYYGRAGIIITILTSISLACTLLPFIFFKRMNMFVCALLFAYTIRTYVLFTGSLFDGEVVKYLSIYLIMVVSFIILVCSVFPNLNEETA